MKRNEKKKKQKVKERKEIVNGQNIAIEIKKGKKKSNNNKQKRKIVKCLGRKIVARQ